MGWRLTPAKHWQRELFCLQFHSAWVPTILIGFWNPTGLGNPYFIGLSGSPQDDVASVDFHKLWEKHMSFQGLTSCVPKSEGVPFLVRGFPPSDF